MRYQDYQFRQGRGMLFACSSSPSGLAKSKHEDVYAWLENVTEISEHRNKARGSNFSTRKTGHSTGWLFSESLLETRVCPGHLQELRTLLSNVYRTLLPSHLRPLSSDSFGEEKPAVLGLHGTPVVMWLTLPPS